MPEPLAGPAAEPLTRAEAKAFLRIDHDAEDALLDALIPAARRLVEAASGRILVDQVFALARDAWPPAGVIALPVAPVSAILSASVTAADGGTRAVPEGALTLKGDRAPALIHVDAALAPAPGPRHYGIRIVVRAGYGAAAQDVPADLVQAVRLAVAHFYELRDGAGAATRLPDAVLALIAPYRVVRL
ncbi:head-tail connector protein [Xanthobacter sp. KR7-225]|uniref:head-tail connector protein n=1 Tax=Xanthobacter sp. KR7-225 TaxID=3156613 RepID=UPI0032B4FC3E